MKEVHNPPSEEVDEVPVGKFVTLFDEHLLLFDQALLSVSYNRRLNILKMLLKITKLSITTSLKISEGSSTYQ